MGGGMRRAGPVAGGDGFLLVHCVVKKLPVAAGHACVMASHAEEQEGG